MIDLHVHSTFSDGSLTPEQLVEEAARSGLSALALTDHDTTGGVPAFLEAGRARGLKVIGGVEISADFSSGTLHMLGYFVDSSNPELTEGLRWIREGREQRNREILRRLNKLGCPLTEDEVAKYAGGEVVGRPHFAQAMVARGYVRDLNEAFRNYLAKGAPAYVDRRRFSPEESLRLIRGAGGVPVLAHPVTLKLGWGELRRRVAAWREAGLEGIEAFYPEHDPNATQELVKLANELGLVVTGGTDFHGAATPGIRLARGYGSLVIPDEVVNALELRWARLNDAGA